MTSLLFSLALALGCGLPAVLSMDFAEFDCWAAWYSRSPWGEGRADLRAGIVAATVANSVRGKGSRPAVPRDFMPYLERSPRATDESVEAVCRARAARR